MGQWWDTLEESLGHVGDCEMQSVRLKNFLRMLFLCFIILGFLSPGSS